jgi:SAM-dependent methyltransferase
MIIQKKYYDKECNRLVYVGTKSNDAYWDAHWENKEFEKKIKITKNSFISNNTNKYLVKGNKILEGGCGRGQNVYLLQKLDYDCIGIDYAKSTVDKINKLAPEINVQLGDVRKLEFTDNSFDGYWSLGVIEHFYNGYDDIIQEMHRVLKEGGVLFLTVPSMSWIRKMKAKFNMYPSWTQNEDDIKKFYQFALDPAMVINDFKSLGFELLEVKPCDGFKGLKDEVKFIKPVMQYIYDSNNIFIKILRKSVDIIMKYFSSHMTLFIFKKI